MAWINASERKPDPDRLVWMERDGELAIVYSTALYPRDKWHPIARPLPSTAKTVRVRIAVGVCADGEWASFGCRDEKDDNMRDEVMDWLDGEAVTIRFVEADIPIPDEPAIEGEVQP